MTDNFDDDKFFEDILGDDDEENKDKPTQSGDDEEGNKPKDQDDGQEQNKGPSLEERLNHLEKENKGLKKAAVEYRQERAQYKGRLDELTSIIREEYQKRGSQPADKKAVDASGQRASTDKGLEQLPVEFGEDGKAYVPADAVKKAIEAEIRTATGKADSVAKELAQTKELQSAQEAFANHVNSILEQKEGRAEAYEKVTKALKLLDDKVIEIQNDMGIEGQIPPGIAIDLLLKTDGALDDYNKLGLPLDIDEVVRCFDSDYVFTKTLDKLITEESSAKASAPSGDDQLLENLKSKPASPGSAKSAKSGGDSVLDKVAGLSTEKLLDLGDDSWDRIMGKMEEEGRDQY